MDPDPLATTSRECCAQKKVPVALIAIRSNAARLPQDGIGRYIVAGLAGM